MEKSPKQNSSIFLFLNREKERLFHLQIMQFSIRMLGR